MLFFVFILHSVVLYKRTCDGVYYFVTFAEAVIHKMNDQKLLCISEPHFIYQLVKKSCNDFFDSLLIYTTLQIMLPECFLTYSSNSSLEI